jgi:hypothetical protein
MLGRFAKVSLVLSAISPVALVFGWVAYRDGDFASAMYLLALCFLLVSICIIVLWLAKNNLERFTFKPSSVEAADRENVAYLMLYLSPLFTTQFSSLNLTVILPTVVIFAVLTATGNSYHFNPLLGLVGWHFYKVASSEGVIYVLITKKHLRNTGQIEEVGQLTDYILIDLEVNRAG